MHVEVDTGMRRTGVMPAEFPEVVRQVAASGRLRIRGLMTHFGCAEEPAKDAFTRAQIACFQEVVAEARRLGLTDFVCHAAATSGAARFPESRLDMVRIGLGLYGIYPSPAVAESIKLELAVALVSRVVDLRTYAAGDRIGYGATFEVPRDDFRVAIIPVGYHDGLPVHLSNRGRVLINGVSAPILGRISMDSAVIDVNHGAGGADRVRGAHLREARRIRVASRRGGRGGRNDPL